MMLTREDNDRITRVGPGTEMGKLMRLYWIPFLLSKEVVPNGQPHQVRLLGEDLVAFRDSSGKVGLVDHACPHRGAPMVFAQNVDGGLRCVYHGWKFDATGGCHEMPAESVETPMLKKVKINAYPVLERNGVLWTYMGPDADSLPELPQVEWNMVPENQVALSMRIQECNWLQALEGEIDSAHAALLHGRHDVGGGVINTWKQGQDLAPKFECVQHDAGVSIASRRKVGEDKNYVRVNQYLMPFWTFVPPQSQFPDLSGHAWVPVDDNLTLCLMFSYHPSQPFYEKTRKIFNEGYQGRETGHHSVNAFEERPISQPYHKYWSKFNRSNAYQFDYASQVSKYNSGLPGLWIQDAAAQSGVSAIYDRSKEHLGVSDTGIARTRRLLMDTLKKLSTENTSPASASNPEKFLIRAVSITIPAGADWTVAGAEFMKAKLGHGFGYEP